MSTPKVNQEVYIIVPNTRDFNLAKGIVTGCFEQSSAMGKYAFIVYTSLGCFYRYPCEMWESVEDFIKDARGFVIEY